MKPSNAQHEDRTSNSKSRNFWVKITTITLIVGATCLVLSQSSKPMSIFRSIQILAGMDADIPMRGYFQNQVEPSICVQLEVDTQTGKFWVVGASPTAQDLFSDFKGAIDAKDPTIGTAHAIMKGEPPKRHDYRLRISKNKFFTWNVEDEVPDWWEYARKTSCSEPASKQYISISSDVIASVKVTEEMRNEFVGAWSLNHRTMVGDVPMGGAIISPKEGYNEFEIVFTGKLRDYFDASTAHFLTDTEIIVQAKGKDEDQKSDAEKKAEEERLSFYLILNGNGELEVWNAAKNVVHLKGKKIPPAKEDL